jgi:hypothetical protein
MALVSLETVLAWLIGTLSDEKNVDFVLGDRDSDQNPTAKRQWRSVKLRIMQRMKQILTWFAML